MSDWPKNAYATAVASIAASGTDTTAGNVIEVGDQEEVIVELKFTGHAAGSAGNITFYFATSIDGTTYSTAGTPLVAPLNANVAVVSEPFVIHTGKAVRYLKFFKIVNGDAAQQVDTLQAVINGREAAAR
jgi:hypothetical protein